MPHKDAKALAEYKREWARKWRAKNPGAQAKKTREWMRKDRAKNPQKHLDRGRKWREANFLAYKSNKIKARVTRMPGERCEACGRQASTLPEKLFADHDHKTKTFRGWICRGCNSALGFAEDSRDRLELLIAYLDSSNLLR